MDVKPLAMNVKPLGEVKGNLGELRGAFFGGFSKSIHAFQKLLKYHLSCALKMYLYSLQMSFYNGSNSASFGCSFTVIMCKHERLTTVYITGDCSVYFGEL